MSNDMAKTPRYVLKDGTFPTCPLLWQTSESKASTVIFGFSDKPHYDAFLAVSTLALTPYPLIRRFLENKIVDVDSLQLVVLDADSAQQQVLEATTFQSVLSSMGATCGTVPVTHRLLLDSRTAQYRIETVANVT